MISLNQDIKILLFDIEGTTSSIAFVHEVLFPFARNNALEYLTKHWDYPEVLALGQKIIEEAWNLNREDRSTVGLPTPELAFQAVCQLMDCDAKVTGLKHLQGLIWKEGFVAKRIQSHVYPEVAQALESFKKNGFRLFIYSSGSIQAQKLYFQHTIYGDLLSFFEGHFDTTSGNKTDSQSYQKISDIIGVKPAEICFFSDAVKEIIAARSVSMQTVWVVRPGNVLSDPPEGPRITNFGEMASDTK